VTDTGIGIKEQDKEKLFKMFGSIKDEEKRLNLKGIGLGLVISKLIVSKFNGYIDFISKYEHGSTFFFTFEIEDSYTDRSQVSLVDEKQLPIQT
jgi:signal transduction histidine kinase